MGDLNIRSSTRAVFYVEQINLSLFTDLGRNIPVTNFKITFVLSLQKKHINDVFMRKDWRD